MITILYVPPGKDGHMIDTFFVATVSNGDATIGLADPELLTSVPCVGHVESEILHDALSERAMRCLAYSKSLRNDSYLKMVKVLGDLAVKYKI